MPLGHNYQFDMGFLKQWLGKTYYEIFDYHYVDTMCIAIFMRDCNMYSFNNVKLKTLCDYFSIDLDPHNELKDALATEQLYKRLKRGVL